MEEINLFDYQQEGVEFLLKHNGGILADEQGLGKTIQALESCKTDPVVFIICPAIMRETWKDEVKKVLNKEALIVKKETGYTQDYCYYVPSTDTEYRGHYCHFIVSYDFVSGHFKMLHKVISSKSDVTIILDESHYIKTPTSKRTKAVCSLLELLSVRRRILLTGTPITRDIDDLYIPLSVFLGRIGNLKSIWEFRKSFMRCVNSFFGVKYTGYKNNIAKNDLKKMLSLCCLRRVKSQVLKDLPSITRKKIIIETNKKIAQESLKLLDYAMAYINQDYASYYLYKKELEDNQIHVATIRRSLGIAKAPQIIDFVKHLFETNRKLVLFCVHTELIDLLATSLSEYYKDKVQVSKIYGGTSDKQKQEIIKDFQTKDNKHLIISNVLAGGVGITLTKSNVVVFGEIDWTPANIMQAEARVHRISQENNVVSYFLVGKDSIDDRILEVLRNKMSIIKGVI